MSPRGIKIGHSLGFSGRSDGAVGQALVLPGRLLLLFAIAFPVAVAAYIAFTEWNPTTGDLWFDAYKHWRWFGKYQEALSTTDFWMAIWRTVLITVVAVAVECVLGFLLAFLFVRDFRGRGLLTVSFLLPMMVVPAVTGFIFFTLLQVDGPVNGALSIILPGEIRIGWLTDPNVAIWSVVIADIWQWTPLMFLIFLAGLVALPEDQLNAARVLGSGFTYQLRHLILPMMKPVILIAVIIRAIETFKIFDSPWLLTGGGPGEASTTVSIFLFRQVLQGTRWGFAAAVAVLILVLVSIAALRAIRPIERAQDERTEELVGAGGGGRREEEPRDEEMRAALAFTAATSAQSVRFEPPLREPVWPRIRPFAKWGVIVLLWAAFMFPLYWTVTMAFKPLLEWNPVGEIFWVPENPTLDNFRQVLGLGRGAGSVGAFKNSVIVASGGTALAMVIGVLVAYGIARFRTGGRVLGFQILQLRMFPPVAIVVPLLIFWAYIGFVDTYHGLIIVYGALTFPFVVWLMRSFFQEVPSEISEAAIVDGCTHWGAFLKTVLPQVKAGLAATALFVFILNWSDFLIAIMLTQNELVTAPMEINVLRTIQFETRFGPESALAVFLIIPPALLGIAIHRYLVRGLTFGAIKR